MNGMIVFGEHGLLILLFLDPDSTLVFLLFLLMTFVYKPVFLYLYSLFRWKVQVASKGLYFRKPKVSLNSQTNLTVFTLICYLGLM